jgi:hypothetical protein
MQPVVGVGLTCHLPVPVVVGDLIPVPATFAALPPPTPTSFPPSMAADVDPGPASLSQLRSAR